MGANVMCMIWNKLKKYTTRFQKKSESTEAVAATSRQMTRKCHDHMARELARSSGDKTDSDIDLGLSRWVEISE